MWISKFDLRRRLACVAILGTTAAIAASGPIPYDTDASWESYTLGVTTGGGLADIDRDGDLDLVVANGNDILRQRVEVYYNDGTGSFPTNPQWQSADVDYHGHLCLGDVDDDGWTDVVVSVFLGPAGFGQEGRAKLYLNQGGTLESNPSWSTADTFFSFACDLGDADGDGDLDLAIATGEPYFDPPDRNRIYFNVGGSLETTPGWLSDAVDHALDVAFADADGDGDLDLAFVGSAGPNTIYYQGPLGIDTSAGWISQDNPSQFGNTLAFGDYDGDGQRELAVSDNNQLPGGRGEFKVYDNVGGSLATTPSWTSFGGFTSAVAWGDLHLDGSPDLAAGTWFGGSRIYVNDSGTLSSSSDWQSDAPSVVEVMLFGDLDGNALLDVAGELHPGDGQRRTFYLDHVPAHEVTAVRADGVLLPETAYAVDLEDGWIALDRAPAELSVDYRYSESLDLAVTNWDQSIGNQVFLRAPRVRTTVGDPVDPTPQPGEALTFDVELASTVGRDQPVTYLGVVLLGGGGFRVLEQEALELAPFETRELNRSLSIPAGLPAQFLGSHTFVAATLIDGEVVSQAEFGFTIVAPD